MADAVLIYADSFRSPTCGMPCRSAFRIRSSTPSRTGAGTSSRARWRPVASASSGSSPSIRPRSFGIDDLIASGVDGGELDAQLALRAVDSLGLKRASVPGNFPVWLADRLRADGVELDVDQELFDDRRRARRPRRRSPGSRRAQRAAEAAMDACRELLRRVRDPRRRAAARRQATHRRAREGGHERRLRRARHDRRRVHRRARRAGRDRARHGFRADPAEQPLVVDIFPRDNASAVYTDMTRTFVVGDVPEDVREWHRLCKEALDRANGEIRAGVEARSVFDGTCDIFEAAGEPTQRTKQPGETLARRLLPRARPRRRPRGARGAEHGPAGEQDARRR